MQRFQLAYAWLLAHKWYILVLCCWLLWALTKFPVRVYIVKPHVCVFGSSESVENAVRSAAQFPNMPHWFVVWGQDVNAHELLNVNIIPGQNTTHASAWEIALQVMRSEQRACDYYFATDDDLVWELTDAGVDDCGSDAMENCLLNFLSVWQPAITTFEWPWGDNFYEPLKDMVHTHKDGLTQPTTGFDNGAIIFHTTVIDFFIPIWLGDDFRPAFTVQHTFLNFFAPFLFMSHAVRFNGIRYVNPPQVRHPYDESALSEDYITHISRNSKCKHDAWGPLLTPQHVTWKPAANNAPYLVDPQQIALFYNVSDSTISQHPFILSLGWTVSDLQTLEAQTNYALTKGKRFLSRPCVTMYDVDSQQ